MTDDTLVQGGGEAVPAADVKPPKNDVEAAEVQVETPEVEKPAEEAPKKRNRTAEYIAKINAERAELARRLAALEAKQEKPAAPKEAPTLEQFNFDPAAYAKAVSEYSVANALQAEREQRQQEETQRKQQDLHASYIQKAQQFVNEHPDFEEVVGSIPYQLSDAVQTAIMALPNAPEIAYQIGQDDDLAFQLASIPAHLAQAAVERIASRMTATPQAPQTTTPVKPVSRAPAPVQTVSGKKPSETPPEKLSDAEWWERHRKRKG